MSAKRRLVLLLLAGLLAGVVVWLPASVIAALLPAGLRCDALVGSVWNGRCAGLGVRGSRSGDLSWALGVPSLRPLRLPVQLTWQRGDSFIMGLVSFSLAGVEAVRIERADVSLQTLRDALPADLALRAVAGLAGRLQGNGVELRLQSARLQGVQGRLSLRDARLLRFDAALGDFAADLQGNRGRVVDLGGPLQLVGELRLEPDGRYRVDAKVEARAPALRQALGLVKPTELAIEGRL